PTSNPPCTLILRTAAPWGSCGERNEHFGAAVASGGRRPCGRSRAAAGRRQGGRPAVRAPDALVSAGGAGGRPAGGCSGGQGRDGAAQPSFAHEDMDRVGVVAAPADRTTHG